jgi:hypothetical protein
VEIPSADCPSLRCFRGCFTCCPAPAAASPGNTCVIIHDYCISCEFNSRAKPSEQQRPTQEGSSLLPRVAPSSTQAPRLAPSSTQARGGSHERGRPAKPARDNNLPLRQHSRLAPGIEHPPLVANGRDQQRGSSASPGRRQKRRDISRCTRRLPFILSILLLSSNFIFFTHRHPNPTLKSVS